MSDPKRLHSRPLGRTPARRLLLLILAAALLPSASAWPAEQPAEQPAAPPAAAPQQAPPDGAAAPGSGEKADDKKAERAKKMTRKEIKEATEKLPGKYKTWLEEVDVLITDDERQSFLELEKDYQRDAFIKRFWEVRDTFKGSRNEFYDRYQVRLAEARAAFDNNLKDQRARIFLLNGPPTVLLRPRCSVLVPVEAWYYRESERLNFEFIVVFYRRWGAGPFMIWQPAEGLNALFQDANAANAGPSRTRNLNAVVEGCIDGDKVAAAINWVARQGIGYSSIQARFEGTPEGPGGEWIATFDSYSTDLPPDAPLLPASLEVGFPGRHQNRTVLQGVVDVPASAAGQIQLADHRSHNFVLTGEILQGKELFDSFRYKFDFPVGDQTADGGLPLIFQRYLRPGDYKMILKLEDLNAKKFFRIEKPLKVPQVDTAMPPPPPTTPQEIESARMLAEANAAISNGETTVKIIQPHGELQTGMLRFDTMTTGTNIDKVTFALDGKPLLTKRKPPFSVELDMGSVPRTRTLSATAYDAGGNQLAGDELLVNAPGHRFRVKLVEPQRGKRYQSSLLARAETEVPEGEAVDRVEFYLNETLIATLYQEPYVQPIVLPKEEPVAYVRTVAYLTDGNSTEELVFVNAPDNLEELEVQYVELYTSVLDRGGRPVEGLEQKDFTVAEDGTRQEVSRFEKVTDLPIHATVALDVSASMDDNVQTAREAALQFFQQAIRPKDRGALITFNDRPTLAVKFTKDPNTLAGGLAGIKAERGTALYDTVIFSLYYFNGIKGQRALLLLSDGKDESSRFSFEDAVDYARRAGVTIYTIGLGEDLDRKKLTRLAEETGGRSFFLQDVNDLAGIYTEVEKELRSKYLIAYQSSNTSNESTFRSVEVKVNRPGMEAKTIRGYYP
ncbi:MAG TPA: VWA domain-containing protein [Thermoanaerobaculia bacterium]|nr:VWA domain-containing protein [Thermoanaerobaculia bacterium]